MSLDLHQLRTFCVVAEEENLSRAAERLYLSAPSVSAHIKALEEELGVALFSRSPRGMTLTTAGAELWDEANKVLQSVNALCRKASELSGGGQGVLRIGLNNPPELLRMDKLIMALASEFPALRFECRVDTSRENLQRIRRDEIDIGFFESDTPQLDLTTRCLGTHRILLIGPREWEDRLQGVSPVQLQEFPWVFVDDGCSLYQFAHRWSREHGFVIEPRIQSYCDDRTAITYAASGLGLTIVSEESLRRSGYRDEIIILPQISGELPLYLGCLKSRESDTLVGAALREAERIWENISLSSAVTA
ncbi:MAG: LysR family transcriptional regulator [Puniceicoccales bacterium]